MTWDGRCRHHRFWLFENMLWCFECGAIRLARMETPTRLVPDGGWVRPVGHGGENPRERKLWKSRKR